MKQTYNLKSFGNNVKINCNTQTLKSIKFQEFKKLKISNSITRGKGNSYGDSSFYDIDLEEYSITWEKNGQIQTTNLNRKELSGIAKEDLKNYTCKVMYDNSLIDLGSRRGHATISTKKNDDIRHNSDLEAFGRVLGMRKVMIKKFEY